MKVPTTTEVQMGYDGITADGPEAGITAELSLLAIKNPRIADTVSRMIASSKALGVWADAGFLRAMLNGALIYGLHMGLHIGEARGRAEADKKKLALYAWVGEDEFGSGVVGLKQGDTPAGRIPLVAMDHHLDRVAKLLPQMEMQATAFGKKIRLMKFEAVEVAAETKAGQ